MTAHIAPAQPESPGALIRQRRLSLGDPLLRWGVRILSWLALAAIVVMLLDTAVHSAKLLEHTSLWSFLTGTAWQPANAIYGALPFIYGTVVTSILALLLAVPLALGAALLVNEYLPARAAAPLAYGIELLAAVPSVVYGFWGVIVLVPALRVVEQAVAASPLGQIPVFSGPVPGPSYLAAGLILAIMILPIVTSVARDAMRATPPLQREGALALGATHWETIRHVVLPFARGGIFAGVILGLSRAIGETIAVLFVIGNQPQINASIFAPGYSLPSVIAGEFAEANQPFHPEALIGLGVVLFAISFAVNLAARGVVGRFETRPAAPMFAEERLRSTGRRRSGTNRFVYLLCFLAGAIALLPLALVLFYLLVEGLKAWSPAFLVSPPGGITSKSGGAMNAILGTLEMTGLGLAIATPTGLAVALYVAEYREGRMAVIVRTAVDLVAGIPSIVIGLFVYSLVVLTMGHFSGFAGAIALSLIMLPIIARTSEEMFKIVPRQLREGTLALAMPRWRAIVSIYIPTVAAGIVTGIVLAVSRAVGETAPLLFTALGSNFVVTDLNRPMSALPLYMFQNALNIGFPAARERAWAAALTLVAIVLVFNVLGRWLASRTGLRAR